MCRLGWLGRQTDAAMVLRLGCGEGAGSGTLVGVKVSCVVSENSRMCYLRIRRWDIYVPELC